MRFPAPSCAAIGLITTLSACGGEGEIFAIRDAPTGPISVTEADQIAQQYAAQSGRVLAFDPTDDLGMPDEGRAVFEGKAELVVSPRGSTETATFIGDATVRADFSQTSIFAQMDSFSGTALNGRSLRLDGEIIMPDGRIGDGSPSNISGAFGGSVMGLGVNIQANGMLFGKFRETPVAAVSLTGSDANASYNDEAATATLTAVAESE